MLTMFFSDNRSGTFIVTKSFFFAAEYNKYAEKTVETIALQDIFNSDGRSKCKDFIEITDANYVPNGAADETVTDVVIAPDGKRDHPYITHFKKYFLNFCIIFRKN